MNLILRQKIFSLFSERYAIKDENQNTKFTIEPKLALLKQFKIYDEGGQLIHHVKQVFSIFPKFQVFDKNGEQIFTAIYKFKFIAPEFYLVDNHGQNILSIIGKPLGFQYDMVEDGEVVARTTKKLISITDTYTLSFEKEENANLYVLAALIYDTVYKDNKN